MLASELAALLGGSLHGPDRAFSGLAPLERAGPDQLAFCRGAPPEGCGAGVLLARSPAEGRSVVVVEDPKAAFGQAIAHLFPELHAPGVHPGAFVDPSARLGEGVVVHPGCWVGARCEIGAGTVLFPNVVLYPDTRMGARCRIHAGAVLGSDGFAYQPGPEGPRKIPHIGGLVIGDDVEIGANSTVDRGMLEDTVIGAGTKLDNLVQVGHNVRLGRAVVIAAQSGIAGSVTIGDGALLGGQSGVVDHVRIGAGARVGAQSGVGKDVAPGEAVLGSPAMPAALARRVFAVLRRLPAWWRTQKD